MTLYKKMKVAHVIPSISPRLGGPAMAMISYARALQLQEKVELTILTTTRLMERGERTRLSQLGNIDVRMFVAVGDTSRSFSASFKSWFLKHVKEFDLIHVHAIFNFVSLSACWIASLNRVPYIIRPLGTLSPFTRRLYSHGAKKAYYTLLAKPVLDRAAYVHCTTGNEERKVSQWIAQRTVSIPIPFELNGWSNWNRSHLQKSTELQPNILFLSRLHPKKNAHLVIEAVGRLKRDKSCKPRLIIAGEGPTDYVNFLHKCARKWGIEDSVEWPGFITGRAKKELFRTAEIFVLPSQDENFGVATVEAMASGLPVIVSQEVDLMPLIQEYKAGLIVKQTGDSLASALNTLIKNPMLRKTFGQNGRRLVKKEFNPEYVGQQLVDLYNKILIGS